MIRPIFNIAAEKDIMENFKFLSISELKGKQFFIPNYQRGYKWEKEQVEDLLNDIEEFMNSEPDKVGQSYCIQPLVVGYADTEDTLLKKVKDANSITDIEGILSHRKMEVIDGQQRLTTIFIMLSSLGVNSSNEFHYSLDYETRPNSRQFLEKLCSVNLLGEAEEEAQENEDFFHIYEAHIVVNKWLEKKEADLKNNYKDFKDQYIHTLLNRVKFIWYLSSDPNPVQVFRRLNDGKISLTDAELIKALVLHCDDKSSKITYERASEWDSFEVLLQDDELWLFIQNEIKYDKPTRIEWIFDMICEKDLLGLENIKKDFREDLGTDNHKTFRYFDLFIRLNNNHLEYEEMATIIWNHAKGIMAAIKEWYTDSQLYHYVGFLIHQRFPVAAIYESWTEQGISKKQFLKYLETQIRIKLNLCKDLSKVYKNKRECLPLLLLHNIEEVLWQNRGLQEDRRYGMGAFYKFPFHLYKKEERKGKRNGWEIEHIASNSGDSDEIKEQAFYLETSKLAISDQALYKRVESFDFSAEDAAVLFSTLREEIRRHLKEEEWSDNDKNKVWNFTLLDSGTNQEYQNSVFPFKRLFILNKEAGIKTSLRYDDKEMKAIIVTEGRAISFIPPVTKKIFTKAFTQSPTNLHSWTTQRDAKSYLLDLELKTEKYLPKIYRWLRLQMTQEDFVSAISEYDIDMLNAWRTIIVTLNWIIRH